LKDIIYFAKVKPTAKIPSKREEDAAFDLYACFDEDYIEIKPHESKLIPTGIASAFDKKYGLVFRERGSTGVKNLKINAGVVDSGYRNEIFVCLYNANISSICIAKKSYLEQNYEPQAIERHTKLGHIYPYEKAIAQALLIPVPETKVVEISYDELKNITSERGMGSLGSSNK
jgi:dUTP pyrophosphatase